MDENGNIDKIELDEGISRIIFLTNILCSELKTSEYHKFLQEINKIKNTGASKDVEEFASLMVNILMKKGII